MQIVSYKGLVATLYNDGSLYLLEFDKHFKSLRGFKRWASIFSYKYLDLKYRGQKKLKIENL